MTQNLKNGTDFVPKPIGPEKAHTRGWPEKNLLSDFVSTILGLSTNEKAILDAVRTYQMPKTAAKIAKTSGINRKMTNRILSAFEKRKIVIVFREEGKRDRWRYNRNLSRLRFK